MSSQRKHTPHSERVEQEAAAWILRIDRGLTAAEQDALSEWLGAEPRRGEQLSRHRQHWDRLDQLAQWLPEHSAQPNPDLLAPPLPFRLRRFVPVLVSLGAAAALVALAWFVQRPETEPSGAGGAVATHEAVENHRELADGSTIELNRGAEIRVEYTARERRVYLERGEAYFTVATDRTRPFIVAAEGVTVRAVGTAFNVRLDVAAIEVLVTEGTVALESPAAPSRSAAGVRLPGSGSPAPDAPVLTARQRAVVPLAQSGGPPQIATLTAGEVERVLAWQHRLLDFTAAPLTDVVAEFNRRNPVQLVLIDPELAAIRISATIRSDNVDGFVRLLEVGFGARAQRRGQTEILLRKAPPAARRPE